MWALNSGVVTSYSQKPPGGNCLTGYGSIIYGPLKGHIGLYRALYAQTLKLVNLIVVNFIGFLVITWNPVGISGPY